MAAADCSDAELVSRTLNGDRDAFKQIVRRHQILICSLAYSRIGHLGLSEDVAQETSITAWKHLRLLREPAKRRAWLQCTACCPYGWFQSLRWPCLSGLG